MLSVWIPNKRHYRDISELVLNAHRLFQQAFEAESQRLVKGNVSQVAVQCVEINSVEAQETESIINYPAASGRGIRKALVGGLRIASDTPLLDSLRNCQSCPHSHVFQQYLQSNRPTRIHLPIVSS